MKLEHIVALGVRLFAIALAIYAMRQAVGMVPHFRDWGWDGVLFVYAAMVISLLLLAVVLWNFPLLVAHGMVNFQGRAETDAASASVDQLHVVGFTILGLYFLFHVISDLVYWGFIWIIIQRGTTIPTELTLEQKGAIAGTAVELVFVLFLLLGTRRTVELLRKFRYGPNA